VWDAATGQLLRHLPGKSGEVRTVHVSRDGRWIAVDATVWYADTGREFSTYPMGAVSFSPDSQWLLGGRIQGGQWLCPLDPLPAALACKYRDLTVEERERYEIGPRGETVPRWSGEPLRIVPHWERAWFLMHRNLWREAAKEYDHVLAQYPGEVQVQVEAARARLLAGDVEGWRRLCVEMLKKPAGELMDLEKDLIVWTCTMAPDAVKDWKPVLALAKVRSKQETAPQTLYRASALLRAGQADEAVAILTGEIRDSYYGRFQQGRQQFLLVLAYARLKRPEDARSALTKAIEKAGTPDPFWGSASRLKQEELALLRSEAERALAGL
jgi:tetratricopeptide (TPR) repeat protein